VSGSFRSPLVGPGEGELNANRMALKVDPAWTESGLLILEATIPPGVFIGPHTHTHEDECTFVIEGELTAEVGEKTVVAPAGSLIVKPRGLRHAFWNTTAGPATILEIHVPGRMRDFYDEFGRAMADTSTTPAERAVNLRSIQRRYGIKPDWEHEAELARTHGLRGR
jgi:mannose-6-phosphate isomerase-like protein (cupin superfamily)